MRLTLGILSLDHYPATVAGDVIIDCLKAWQQGFGTPGLDLRYPYFTRLFCEMEITRGPLHDPVAQLPAIRAEFRANGVAFQRDLAFAARTVNPYGNIRDADGRDKRMAVGRHGDAFFLRWSG